MRRRLSTKWKRTEKCSYQRSSSLVLFLRRPGRTDRGISDSDGNHILRLAQATPCCPCYSRHNSVVTQNCRA